MSNSLEVRNKLLRMLANGDFHSGQHLAETFGLSRTAISKHVKYLTSLGLDIFSVTGKGYKLATPISLLNSQEIVQASAQAWPAPIEVLNIIDSTNRYIKERAFELENGHVCLAEAQTAGRGRQGKTWVSPYAASLYLSCQWSFTGGYQAITGLSLAVGIAIVDALTELDVPQANLKWPNDVYHDNKKLAGVLIEVEGQMGGACHCIIGIGLNINMPPNIEGIDQAWTDLASATGQQFNRNLVAAKVLDSLLTVLRRFEQDGIEAFVEQWQKHDLFKGKMIKLVLGKESVQGLSMGIDKDGALLLKVNDKVKRFNGGEISVRKI